ncbi:PREDICTED: LRR receptor-like serine/threonine-protein kinase ERECTA isoform X3 [Theobroma cacao]|uniref:LRR receptor-like serine/threonine-protein kinase ERECTA isoform X3 n=1 Tax=Theobroma cacao TaxID=3641 RepID=A0AB32WJ27_THECC|nr:PREDICTED: LRR receptor-like serine/threonine-protein kinase ERECTA isoform X3 [Theobroma cacao]
MGCGGNSLKMFCACHTSRSSVYLVMMISWKSTSQRLIGVVLSSCYESHIHLLWQKYLIQLAILGLSRLMGPLPYHVSGLSRLLRLHLDHNFLSGRVPNWLFTLPTLVDLDLSYNGLTGPIDPFEKVAPLEIVKLQNNEIHGPIPSSVFKLVNLIHLNLSSNKLNGIFELDKLSKLNKLQPLIFRATNSKEKFQK